MTLIGRWAMAITIFMLLLPWASSAQWIPANFPRANYIHSLTLSQGNLFAATDSGVFVSSDNGKNWESRNKGLSNSFISSLISRGSDLYVASQGVFRSTDEGLSWTRISDSLMELSGVSALATSATSIFVTGNSGGVWRSTDSGSTWTLGLDSANLDHIATTGSNIFAAGGRTQNNQGLVLGGVYTSTDDGSTWKTLFRSSALSIVLASSDSGVYIINQAMAETGVYYYSISAETTQQRFGLPVLGVYSIATEGNAVFAGTEFSGVFLSTDKGLTWAPVDSGLTTESASSIFVCGENLFVETNNFPPLGLFWRPISEMVTIVKTMDPRPQTRVSLFQNYPNPFNPGTTIRYELPAASMVSLRVYDILGREVAILVNERKNAGSYQVRFDGTNLASGFYLYRLEAGTFTQIRKLILLK